MIYFNKTMQNHMLVVGEEGAGAGLACLSPVEDLWCKWLHSLKPVCKKNRTKLHLKHFITGVFCP